MKSPSQFCCKILAIGCLIASGLVGVARADIQMRVDANFDGVVAFPHKRPPRTPVDETTLGKPFLIWWNSDQDDKTYDETVPITESDSGDEAINSLRDMEDLMRLHIRLDAESRALLNDGEVSLRLRWREPDGAPGLRVFMSADRSGSHSYVTDRNAARDQLIEPFLNSIAVLGIDNASDTAEIAPEPLPSWQSEDPFVALLFEGTSAGKGILLSELVRDGEVIQISNPVHIEMNHVQSYYLRVNSLWSGRRSAPWYDLDQSPDPPQPDWQLEDFGHPFIEPWYEQKEIIIWSFGWIKEGREQYENCTLLTSDTVYKRLRRQGYKGRLTFFRWDTSKTLMVFGLKRSQYFSLKFGGTFKDYVDSVPNDFRKHVTGHSMGGMVLLEALKQGMVAETALFQQTSVPACAFDPSPKLDLPDWRPGVTPETADELGYRGYLSETKTPIYNMYNADDAALLMWVIGEKQTKPSKGATRGYKYYPGAEYPVMLETLFNVTKRPVTDPHESMAFVARTTSQALGAEPRTGGVVIDSISLDSFPFDFGGGHVQQMAWDPQRTTYFYCALLDIFGLPFNAH